ncbi:MAG: tetratricopeptide repeat protein [Nitrospirae bacterium]|nr:tetratricopeptide repeat protein [Nitrospirota bacterium]
MMRVRSFLLALLVLATVLTFRGVIANGFVVDDYHTVQTNRALRSLTMWRQWLTSPDAASRFRGAKNYRPVLITSYGLDHALWGDEPSGFHATNLAVHLAVVILTFLLARRLWSDDATAICAAGLVALHPLNAEAVNYLSARSSSLMTAGVLAAVWADDAARGRRWVRRLPAFGFGLAALGSKEVAVVLPALMIAWERARVGDTVRWRTTVLRSIPWWGLVGAFLAARTWLLRDAPSQPVLWPDMTLPQNLLFAAKIGLVSFGHWWWPSRLALDHAWPTTIGTWEAAGLLVGTVAVGVATWGVFKTDRRIGWCAVWFWLGILPVGALPFVTRVTLYQENRVYLAAIGLAWLAGRFLGVAVRDGALGRTGVGGRFAVWERAALAVVLSVAVVAAVRVDRARTAVFTDDTRLWNDVLEKYPRSALGRNARAVQLLNAGRLDEARRGFEEARDLDPHFALYRLELARTDALQGNWERAAAEFDALINADPGYFGSLRVELGEADEHLGRMNDAFEQYQAAARLQPTDPDPVFRLAVLHATFGHWADAAEAFRRAIDRNAEHYASHLNLALLEDRLKHGASAIEHYRAFLKTAPQGPTYETSRIQAQAAIDRLTDERRP